MDNVHLQLLAEEIRKIYKNLTKYKGVSKHLKEAIDLFSEDNIVNHITTINIEPGVEVEVTYLNKKKKKYFFVIMH